MSENKLATLHILNKPLDEASAQKLRAAIQDDDAVLFIEDANYINPTINHLSVPIYQLKPDCLIRGVTIPKTSRIVENHAEFVQLIVQFDKNTTWQFS